LSKNVLLGKVIHYYDKIGVAVVKLGKEIKTGDKVKFVHGDKELEQAILSMQLEHEQIKAGKKGQEVAIKVNEEVKNGSQVLSV
jgi:ribosomal 50S subunit-recycling heat shock protein